MPSDWVLKFEKKILSQIRIVNQMRKLWKDLFLRKLGKLRLEKAEFRIDVFNLTTRGEAISPSPDEEMSKLLPPKICGDELKTTRSCGAQQESQSLSLKRNESNLDFMSSYFTRNLDSFYVPRSCFSLKVHAKPSGCFLKFGPKRRLQSGYIPLSWRGGTSHTALLLSFSVLASQRFQLPSSFWAFSFFYS